MEAEARVQWKEIEKAFKAQGDDIRTINRRSSRHRDDINSNADWMNQCKEMVNSLAERVQFLEDANVEKEGRVNALEEKVPLLFG